MLTPWEEINSSQDHLIDLLRTAKETIDYQNIGNASRTLLQKVSSIVFDIVKHVAPEEIDTSEGKFKNRLHTYIESEIAGSENSEFRNYALAIITASEKSVDLANKLTHDLNASNFMAESCVICTLTVISIIKMIHSAGV